MIFHSFLTEIVQDPYGKGCLMINSTTEMTNQNAAIAKFATDDFAGMEELSRNWLNKDRPMAK